MKRLALLGAGGHGKVVADMALISGWDAVTFFDDAWPRRKSNGRWEVMGTGADLLASLPEFDGVVVSIGDCKLRREHHRILVQSGASMATIVHPRAWLSQHVTLGAGSVVMAGAVVNVDAIIGAAGVINTGATVDHDCELGEAVHIGPGAHLSGDVSVGHCSWIGVGAVVRQGLSIGCHAMVGAGAVVVAPVVDASTVIGNPARPMRDR